MKVRVAISTLAGLALMVGFQNCGGAAGMGEAGLSSYPSAEKVSLVGRFKIDKFVATSSCPDLDLEGVVCSAIYEEDDAQESQVVEFLPDGTLIVEGACNTYYSRYELESNGSLGRIIVDELSGTSAACEGMKAEEESLLIFRLSQSVRVVEEGPESLTIFTDLSSALKLEKHL